MIAAYAIPFVVLPSSMWRIAAVFLDPDTEGKSGDLPSWLPVEIYVIFLSVLSEAAAFVAVGLIATWGEVFPRRLPRLGGRRVPSAVAAVPAALAAVTLTVLSVATVVAGAAGVTLRGEPTPDDFPTRAGGWQAVLFYVSYVPLLLWGPLLAVVTAAYVKRRRTSRPGSDAPCEHRLLARGRA